MRKKKYIELKNMGALGIDVLDKLEYDVEFEQQLAYESYFITTNGGLNILWEVNPPGEETYYTVSTGELGRVSIGMGRYVPKYKHYKLTEQGIAECKQKIMEASFG